MDSKHTLRRIQKSGITAYDTDAELVGAVDVLLSIVPPRDATATAVRILEASRDPEAIKARTERKIDAPDDMLVFVDCNAISPRTARGIHALFIPKEEKVPQSPLQVPQSPPLQSPSAVPRRFSLTRVLSFRSTTPDSTTPPPPPPIPVAFLDGGIIGGPPHPKATNSTAESSSSSNTEWVLPSLVMSGPHIHTYLPAALRQALNITILDHSIGTASTLKSCFASLTKGMTALATISFSTAQQANILPQLTSHLEKFSPKTLDHVSKSMVGMPPKAYRWVDEMRQIGSTFASEGGLDCGEDIFKGVAELYRFVAEDTVLGEERTESRKRGTTAEDVATAVGEGVEKKRKGNGNGTHGDEELKIAWRGSWT